MPMKETAQVAYEAHKYAIDRRYDRVAAMPNWDSLADELKNHWRESTAAAVGYERAYGMKFGEHTPQWGLRIEMQLNTLHKEIKAMEETTVTRADLDAAIASLLQAEATRDAAVTTAITNLEAKIAAGAVATPEDFSAELATIKTLQANAAAITATATADDPGQTEVPPTPLTDAAGTALTADTTNTATDGADAGTAAADAAASALQNGQGAAKDDTVHPVTQEPQTNA